MSVDIPEELAEYVRAQTAESGKSVEDVLSEALRLHREVQARRHALLQAVREGIDSGDSLPADEVFEELYRRVARHDR